ncbi:MAG: cobalamin biosynthesis protein CbiM [Chromatiaceae bacterium]|nr:MAG: cobalamin biosynthesis protein CbiM [Chromatiaceae bacterium]
MHIEPGYLSAAKVIGANVAAAGLLAAALPSLVKQPLLIPRTLAAALFFSLFMQAFHLPVGASELHFVGAMPIYLILGFVPTLLGFGLGLLLQGLLFEPADLLHLGVNTLSLAVPLVAVYYGLGRHVQRLSIPAVLKLDASYYAGVTLMVGFWLLLGEEATALADWALFATSYLALVLIEPLLTLALVRLLQPHTGHPLLRTLVDLRAPA